MEHVFEIFPFRQRHGDECCDPEATQKDFASNCKSKVPVHVGQAAPAYDSEGVGLQLDKSKRRAGKRKD